MTSIIPKTPGEILYNDFHHYGTILKQEDFDFTSDKIFITMKTIQYKNQKILFILKNGELIHYEILKGGIQ